MERERGRNRREAREAGRRPEMDDYRDVQLEPLGITLRRYLTILRRRWPVPVLAVVLSVGLAGWWLQRRAPEYTAEALLQVEQESSPVLDLTTVASQGALELRQEAEQVLRSRTVLTGVIDSLGLRVRLEPDGPRRTELLADVRVGPEAPRGEYLLTLRDGAPLLLSRETDEVVLRGSREGVLESPGLRLRVAAAVPVDGVELGIVSREDALEAVREALRVEGVGQTRLVRTRYTAHDPALAAAVINVASDAYRDYSAGRARQQAQQRRSFIENRLREIADSLSIAQEALVGYQESSGQLPPEIEGDVTVQALMTAEGEVRAVRFQESLLNNLLATLETGGTGEALPRILALSGELLPVGKDLYERLQELQIERRKLTSSEFGYTEESPQVETVDSLIASTREEVRQVASQSLQVLQQRRRTLEERIAQLRAQVGDLPTQVAAYTRLKQRVDAVQDVYNLLIEKYWEAQIAEASAEGNVQVVEAATVPIEPDPSHALRILIFALMLGMALGVGGALTWDAIDPRIRDVQDVEDAGDVAVLSTIPPLAAANSGRPPPLPADTDADGPQLEAFRMLRTNLMFARAERPRRLAITSAGPQEGKTLVAANLALTLARQGETVLLVDADLRRPMVHRVFDIEKEPGLTDLLVGHTTIEEAVRTWSDESLPGWGLEAADDGTPANADRTGQGRLDLLTAGSRSPLPAELLGSRQFESLMNEAVDRYDSVVVDTAPVLAVSDTTLVGRVCDGMLLVARARTTNRYALARTLEQLRGLDRPLLGVVLNDIASGQAYPGYGYSHYYSYSESSG